MAGKSVTRGLNIVVDGKTEKFNSAMAKSTDVVKETKSEVLALKRSLQTEWNNTTFLNAQKAATEAVKATENKVKLLKDSLKQIGDVDTQEAKQQIKHLSVELVKAETAAKQAHKQLDSINQMKFDRVTNLLGKLGDNMMKSGAILTAGVTLPLAYVGKQALETASDLVEVQNVVDTAFKNSAGVVNEWSKTLLDSNGISELTAKQNAGLYKSMANGMGVANQAGSEMAMTLTELTSDLASYYNVSIDVAGTALKSIFTGETESLKQFVVIMTEANVNAYALSHGMAQLSDDMTQSEKVSLRYGFVLDTLKDVQGDFGRTSDSMANQTRLAQERFKSLSAELAQELLPVATDILKWANDCMKSFDKLSESEKKNILVILGLAAGLGPVVTVLGGIVKGCELGVKAWQGISTAVSGFKKANDAAIASQAALNTTMLASPYAVVAIAIVAVAGAVLAYKSAVESAMEETNKLREEFDSTIQSYTASVDSIKDNVDSKQAELDVTDKLIARYEQLNGKVGLTASERQELSEIVNQLNGLLSIEIGLVNDGTGAFDTSAASLRNLTQARREEIEQIARRDEAIATQKALNKIEEELPGIKKNYDELSDKVTSRGDWAFTWDKNAADKAGDLWDATLEKQKKLQEKLKKLTEEMGNDSNKTREKSLKSDLNVLEKSFTKEKELLDYRRSIGLESEESYYRQLKQLKTQFFSETEKAYADMTEEERRLNVEIYNQEVSLNQKRLSNAKSYASEKAKIDKENYDNQKKLAKEAYEQNKKLLKDSYDESKKALEQRYKDEVKAIDDAYKAKEKATREMIQAIDKEIEARKRLKHEEEYNKQSDSIKAQLAYGKLDEFTRRELEAELKRLQEEEAEYKWELEQNDRKAALEEELENAKQVADSRKEELNEMYEISKTQLDEQYAKQLEFLDTAYVLHLEHLDIVLQTTASEMWKISNNFVDTIKKGCLQAVAILQSVMGGATVSMQQTSVPSPTTSSYQNNATMNVYGSNYTSDQMTRMLDKMLYENID